MTRSPDPPGGLMPHPQHNHAEGADSMKVSAGWSRPRRRVVPGALAIAGCLVTPSLSAAAAAAPEHVPSPVCTDPARQLLAQPGRASWPRWKARLAGHQAGSAERGSAAERGGQAGVSVPVGSAPQATPLDAATHTLYVANGSCKATVTSPAPHGGNCRVPGGRPSLAQRCWPAPGPTVELLVPTLWTGSRC